jgi:tripartite-type tricarboxylate transporter receptor subunit TctC
MRSFSFLVAAVASLACTASARADAVSDFYHGKTVTLMISGSAGGGYDVLGRAVAKHLGKYIPGAPTVVVKNAPGAGGILLTNQMFNTVPKDGTIIASVQNNTPFEPLYGTKEADYDARRFLYVGSPSAEVALIAVWSGAGVATLDDARRRELTMGSSGKNSTPSFFARLANETLGTKLKIIVGYPGQNDALLAMERGEIDGYPSAFYNSLMSTRPTWIAEGKVKLLVQFGAKKEPAIEAVPLASDIARNDDDRKLIDASAAPLALGRPYILPPGTPPERVAAMRKAFADVMRDPDFQAENERAQLGANRPQTGEELEAIIHRTYDTAPAVLDRLRALLQ